MARVKMQCTLPCPDRRRYLRMFVLLMVLALISTEWVTVQSMHRSKSSETFCYHSRVDSQILTTTSRPSVKPWVWSPPELPVLNRPSMPFLPRWRRLQHWNRTSALLQKMSTLSLHPFPNWKRMQRLSPADPARQDLGIFSDFAMAPQALDLLGPTAQGHLMTVEIRGVDLIRSQAPKMNRHEVPSYYGSHANNTTMGLRSGSMIFAKNPICPHTTNLSEFIAKQFLRRPDSFLKHEPNVRTLWSDIKMMVSHTKLTVPSAAPIQLSLSANPNQLKTERLENNVRLCAENWLTNLKFSSLMEMTKVRLSSQRSMPAHKSSAKRIEETGSENRCSNLPLQEGDSCWPLLQLTCVFLVFPVKCCNGSSLKPARPMCDGRPFTSPLFRRLAGRGALFGGFPFRWVLHFVLFLTRSVIMHDATSCSREDSLYERVGPCDTLSCFFFSALWLQRSQSILVQEIQSAKDIDVTCFKTFPIKAATCLQVGPMSLDWPVDPFARFDQSRPSSSPEDPIVDQQRGSLPASTRCRWRQDALQPPQALQGIAGGDACGHFLSEGMRCVTWNTRGLVGSVFSKQKKREFKLKYLKSLFDANNILCHQEVHGKDEYLQAIQVMAPRFRLFGTFLPDNENAGGSAICIHRDLLPEEAVVTHLITCQGRDHIVNIQSGRQGLVIVNVPFELELTLRQLRERLRLINPRWP